MMTLQELYDAHQGKVSDKWSSYLPLYDSLFEPYRSREVRLLEIGVQNGGSLELWARYFPKASALIGCDIDERCGEIRYEDPRVSIIVGDANSDEAQAQILTRTDRFDIVIDDGSHTSSDIVRSFVRYFAHLEEGGIFVAEDLHCSYWQSYEGGLYDPYSAVSFFKRLSDVVNFEHWGVELKRSDVLAGIADRYGVQFDEQLLASIGAVTFHNSVCTVRKRAPSENLLGKRLIVGQEAAVREEVMELSRETAQAPVQSGNPWSCLMKAPDEAWESSVREVSDLQSQQSALTADRDNQARRVVLLTDRIDRDSRELAELRKQVKQLEQQTTMQAQRIQQLEQVEVALRSSTSWRVTGPLRLASVATRHLARAGRDATRLVARHGVAGTARRAREIYDREGLGGLRRRVGTAGLLNPANDYVEWVKRYDTLDDERRENIRQRVAEMPARPLISVVMPTYNPNPAWLAEAIESVRNQLYDRWELCIADDASTDPEVRNVLQHYGELDARVKVCFREQNGHISAASNSALELAEGEWVALLDHDDLLPEHALFCVAEAIAANPDARLIYSDEDKIDEQGVRHNPYFKSEWNADLFLSHNMFSHLGVYHRPLLQEIGGFRLGIEGSQDYDLALRSMEKVPQSSIVHIPRVLYHWRVHAESTAGGAQAKPYAMLAGARAINEHFQRRGIKAEVTFNGYGYHAEYDLPDDPPLVSIIIPTRNGYELLRQCITSLLETTRYERFEIIVVDNGSDDEQVLSYLEAIKSDRISVIHDSRPFNYSALNNLAVRQARGDVIALLNNDIEVISPGWLGEMVSHALRPEVGAVGAKLLYPDATVQHGGVLLGVGGIAVHAHRGIPSNAHGYFSRATLINRFSAVTGACLVVRKALYEELGGLDEENLAVAYNDIDFCLRLREAGYHNVWLPSAQLYHHESATRGPDTDPAKVARLEKESHYMRQRWAAWLENDPGYNPNLTNVAEDFSLAWPPRLPPVGSMESR